MSQTEAAVPSTAIDPRGLFGAACATMFVFGMLVALLGTLFGLPEMRVRLGIDLARQGDLFSILFVGIISATTVVGPTIDRYGSKVVLVGASAAVTAALLAFGVAGSFRTAAAAALLLGLGGGWLNAATNALVSDIYPTDRGRMLNYLGVFFGVGALFVPLIVSVGYGVLSITGTILVCAAVAGGATVAAAVRRFPPPREAAAFSWSGMLAVARDRGVLLFAAMLFFQSGNEASLSGWTSTYIGSVGWSPRAATIVLLGYWVMAIIGRSWSARLQEHLGKSRLILLSALVSMVGCVILLAASRWFIPLTAGAWLTALAFSSIFPTSLALVGDRYHRFAGTVFGFLFSVANIGGMVFPWALGHVSQAFGVRLGMVIPLAGTLAVTLCALLVLRGAAGRTPAPTVRTDGAQPADW